MLCEREELLFRVGATNTILPPNKEIFGPRKALQNGPTYQNTVFFEKMVKWVAHDTIGALLPIRTTNFSNTNGNTTEKIKGRYENKKLVVINLPICLLLAGNLKCTCSQLLAGKLRWIKNNCW